MSNSLKQRIAQNKILVAPGVYDALTATIAESAGFEALYLSGAAVSYTRLGRPDIGLTSVSEMQDTMALIADRVDIPVIIDADAGFGNALNAQRTMQQYERAGAQALQLEDQSHPKRCGHLTEKSFPGGIVRALARTAQDYYNNLHKQGSNRAFADRMFDFNGLNEVLETTDLLEQGKRYSE